MLSSNDDQVALEQAWLANACREWPVALRCWEHIRARSPDNPTAYLGGATALREAGQPEEADQLLREASERFPANEQVALARAWLATGQRDWSVALCRWEDFRVQYPSNPAGYAGGAHALRRAGQQEQALRLLEEASERFSADDQVLLEHAWLANARRDWPAALHYWQEVRARDPLNPVGYLGGAAALREASHLEEAERLLADASARFPANDQVAVAQAWLANACRNWPLALRRWESLRARCPDDLAGYIGGANALRESGRSDEATVLLDTATVILASAKQRGFDTETIGQLEVDIALARHDWLAVRLSVGRVMSQQTTPSARLFLDLARACWHLRDVEAADRAAQRALVVEPTLADAILLRAMVATDRGDGEVAVSCYRRLIELNPGVIRWSLKLVQLLNWLGHVDEAVLELDNLNRQWPNDPMVRMFQRHYGPAAAVPLGPPAADELGPDLDLDRADEIELRALAEKAPSPAEYGRPSLAVDPGRDVLVAEIDGSETAILVFTGSNDQVSMPLPLFDRYLAPLAITSVCVKDFNRLRFMKGIKSLGGTYLETLIVLRQLLANLGVRRLLVIGNCDGGFAAIRYGVELNASRVIAFHAPTYSPSETLAHLEQARNFMRKRMAAVVPAEMADLRPFLQSRQHTTDIMLFYDADDSRDCMHAKHLSGLPGVRLHPQPGSSNHRLLRNLALKSNDFSSVLARLLALERADECGRKAPC